MKKFNFKEEYNKCDMTAFNYETKGEYMSYCEKCSQRMMKIRKIH